MKNEWDFFADVQRRLATGQPMVQGYFANPVLFPFDDQRGLVLDEDGNQYELGTDYKQALNECTQQVHAAWGLCFRERLIRFGHKVAHLDSADYIIPYPATAEPGSR